MNHKFAALMTCGWVAACFAAGAAPAASPTPATTIDTFAWLAGCWSADGAAAGSDGRFEYQAHPSGQPAAAFGLLRSDADSFVFENPAHIDYPMTRSQCGLKTSSTTVDIPYRTDPGLPLVGTLYRPRGDGPFPLVVYVHGGVWTSQTRATAQAIAQALADDGIAVYAIDFRMPPAAAYPASIHDVNDAVRWAKAHAAQLATRADWVGLMGESSGGHQAMLVAMRPEPDASVPFVVSCWGVLDPLARYHYAQERHLQNLVSGHDSYWGSEKNMAEGNPQLLLERHDAVALPPVLAVYGTADRNVPTTIPEHFVASYRKAGGEITPLRYADAPHGFIRAPFDARSQEALAEIRSFIHRHTDRYDASIRR